MDLRQMQEQRETLIAGGRERLDQINASTDEARTAELESQHDAAMAELDVLDTKIDRELKQQERERLTVEFEERMNRGDSRRPTGDGEGAGSDDGDPLDYRAAFHAYVRAQGNVAALTSEERSALTHGYEAIENRAQTTGSDAAGGYTVPDELSKILVRAMADWGPMYDENVATVLETVTGASFAVPTIDDLDQEAGAHTEGETLTDDGSADAVFGQKMLEAFAYNTKWIRVSKELADDSILAMEQLLGSLLGERLGRLANKQLTIGNGVGAANGIVSASVLGHTTAGAAAIVSDELLDMEHSVNAAYRRSPKCRWMFNDNTLLALKKLKDGDGNYLWNGGDVQAGVPQTYSNKPYSVNDDMADIGSGNKSVLFGDFSKYYVRKVGAPLIGAISDKDFWPGFGVAGYIRFDGELSDTRAVKHLQHA